MSQFSNTRAADAQAAKTANANLQSLLNAIANSPTAWARHPEIENFEAFQWLLKNTQLTIGWNGTAITTAQLGS